MPNWVATADCTNPSPQMAYPGLGFPHRAGRYSPGGSPISFPVFRRCRRVEGFLIRGWDLILLGWRCFHEYQPVSDQPVRLGFSHRSGWYRPGGSLFSCPVCWRRRRMKGFKILGWDLIFLGWRWLHEHQPINNQSVEFSHRSEGYCIDPGDHCFRLRFVRVVDV